jgi:hypothetical protein
MHDAIHRELQQARVADLYRRAQQDRRELEAARQWRRRALGRVLAALSAHRSTLSRADAAGKPASDPAPLTDNPA